MSSGIDDEPMADIERHPDRWETSRVWPPRPSSCGGSIIETGRGSHRLSHTKARPNEPPPADPARLPDTG
ncbi:hypothetical protein F9278_40655 [Streptomyces phaeolivaceus]|uniref:Uncharacterized protein n=1 Tax=Streptomyces phaeolivaceus TaxID=2653200 RepID=A0A5P8KF90_9ACTN|nr:hypothetical protein F9278_40655 [Streptomyces phaeolivaceus]